jgi:BMFP domain-containing protein YqiC
LAAAARDENETLKARIAALEAKVAGPASAMTPKTGGRKPKANPGA